MSDTTDEPTTDEAEGTDFAAGTGTDGTDPGADPSAPFYDEQHANTDDGEDAEDTEDTEDTGDEVAEPAAE